MRTLPTVLIAAIALVAATPAHAQTDGQTLLRACGAVVKQADGARVDQEDIVQVVYCLGYVGGFLDGVPVALMQSKGKPIYCLPTAGISNEQAARVLVKYLREHPEQLHESARISFYVALAKAFPCR